MAASSAQFDGIELSETAKNPKLFLRITILHAPVIDPIKFKYIKWSNIPPPRLWKDSR